jgi:hypothetical protein
MPMASDDLQTTRDGFPKPRQTNKRQTMTTVTWQPIETSSKEDGASVLLWDGRDVFEGYWEASRDFWATADGGGAYPVPTHWMPMPEGPEA